MDLVLTEGFKRENKPKIELYRKTNEKEYLLCSEDELFAIVSDDPLPIETNKPVFKFNDISILTEYMLNSPLNGENQERKWV